MSKNQVATQLIIQCTKPASDHGNYVTAQEMETALSELRNKRLTRQEETEVVRALESYLLESMKAGKIVDAQGHVVPATDGQKVSELIRGNAPYRVGAIWVENGRSAWAMLQERLSADSIGKR